MLSGPPDSDRNPDTCWNYFAVDRNNRYQFDTQVRADDAYRNHQIDLLLATPEERKAMSAKATFLCIPQERPGVNFGYQRYTGENGGPGTIRIVHYPDAALVEVQLMNSEGQWQALPAIIDMGGPNDCNSIGVERFYAVDKKPWLARRDATSISLRINQFGGEPIFVICDNRFSVKLVFSKTTLLRELNDALKTSTVMPFDGNEAGWSPGWILENKFFLSKEGSPEVFLPLKIRNSPTAYQEGRDFVTVGFRAREGQFDCIDKPLCLKYAVPESFRVDLR